VARHNGGFTRSLGDTAAWLAVNTSKNRDLPAATDRVAHGRAICERVSAEAKAGRDPYANLTEPGFDEISIRKGQEYLTVVVDHHTGRLVWASFGRDRKTVEKFLNLIGEERLQQIRVISSDTPTGSRGRSQSAAQTPRSALTRGTSSRLPPTPWTRSAARCGTRLAAPGNKQLAKQLKGARFACGSAGEPDRPPTGQARLHPDAQRADLPRLPTQRTAARDLPRGHYRGRARAARGVAELGPTLPARAVRQTRPVHHRPAPQGRSRPAATLSNARVEQVTTQIRLIVRRGFGHRSPQAVIALAMLSLGGLCPPLPGR
jgi:transposase